MINPAAFQLDQLGWRRKVFGLLLLCLVSSTASVTYAAEKKKVISQQTYKVLMAAQESLDKGESARAIAMLKKLQAALDKKAYEQAIVLQTISHAYISQDDYTAAIPPLKRSLDLAAMPEEPQQRMHYNLIKLHMATEGFIEVIALLQSWFAMVEQPQAEPHVMLATAYLQLGRYKEAVEPLREAIKISKEPKESWYQSLLGAYSELKHYDHCITLLHTMLKLYPDRPNYWRQLVGIQLAESKFRDALATMELAYLRGYVETEQEILSLAQLYLHLNAPYKAAVLLENEIRHSRLAKTEKNWEHAANAWLLARETGKAVAALEKAKAKLRNPQLGLRLAQLYMASQRWVEAGKTLDTILKAGKLNATGTGQAWILLGIAQHEAKSLPEARAAFEQAKKHRKTADSAEQWLAFLDQT
ncbi:hypothetical protein MNBD_GAMMA26-2514 [hydrothermal vent metagenome]|uniref:Anaphase-promoting complex subunit 5 domain-containing protein n=1 Tax=hydrothermal vent metagenome TaxID=652676 RepID=A0A3B1BYH5_9ZZZZ